MTTEAMERQRLIELSSKRSKPSSPGPFTALSDMPKTPVKCSPPPSLQDSGYFASGLDSTPRNLRLRPILRHAYPAPLEALRPTYWSQPTVPGSPGPLPGGGCSGGQPRVWSSRQQSQQDQHEVRGDPVREGAGDKPRTGRH